MTSAMITRSIGLFLAAGLAEIGGGYLIWLTLREGRSPWLAVCGGLVLVLYGVIPTLQPAGFGRVYAAYGGFFILLSLLWGWVFQGSTPDRWDVLGAMVSIVGALIIMYAPRAH